jgi:hypothetical protein
MMKGQATSASLEIFDWAGIGRGEEIEVLDNNIVISRGVVDDYTSDRSILWLHLSYGGGRRLFHREDGWQIRAVNQAPTAPNGRQSAG